MSTAGITPAAPFVGAVPLFRMKHSLHLLQERNNLPNQEYIENAGRLFLLHLSMKHNLCKCFHQLVFY